MNESKVGNLFLKYLKNRDFDNLKTILSEDIVFQAVLPSKTPFREVKNNTEAAGYFQSWFGDTDRFKMKKSAVKHLHDQRYYISYRLDLHDSDGWQKIFQSFYCDIQDGRINSIALNCSGFLPLK